MSKFTDNLAVIPRVAKVIAWIAALGSGAGIAYLTSFPPDGKPVPPAARVLMPILVAVVVLVLIHLIGYVYGDAKRRGMRYVMWTLLAIFVPDSIGIILYFILRDPLPVNCPKCGASVLSKYTFCPSCGTSVKPTCPQCGKPVEPTWRNCGHCGAPLPGVPQRAA
ncbi:MAG TPA: zinc ribbon domain-containing protein [Candidatus Acidoferrales bacterium]|nr:zinc ribbon domain-containing protein [Candidatus Acidoferrales bacterium]